jgi:hypothetical protein
MLTLAPVIEAEVRYAVRHEYAQTAVDVLARRTRLSFLNAQAALDALPRIVDIMATEHSWSRARQAAEVERARTFLTSMGLPAASAPTPAPTLRARVESALGMGAPAAAATLIHGRSQVGAGEMDAFKGAFRRETGADGERLPRGAALGLVQSLPGYETVSRKEYEYVLDQAGLRERDAFDVNDFVEVRAEHCVVTTFVEMLSRSAQNSRKCRPRPRPRPYRQKRRSRGGRSLSNGRAVAYENMCSDLYCVAYFSHSHVGLYIALDCVGTHYISATINPFTTFS